MNVETEAKTQRLRSEQRRNAGSISSSTVDEAARLGERIGGQPGYLSLGTCTQPRLFSGRQRENPRYPWLMDRIEINPQICNGRPVIRGTRITAQTILEFLGAGDSIEDIPAAYPTLTRADVLATIRSELST
jgi:uncharacterized protein (DUF433 family)